MTTRRPNPFELTKNRIFCRIITTAVGTTGTADGGGRMQNCTCHLRPGKISGISSSRMIWMISRSTGGGTVSKRPNADRALGRYGGITTRLSKKRSRMCRSSGIHWNGGGNGFCWSAMPGGSWVSFRCSDWWCCGLRKT